MKIQIDISGELWTKFREKVQADGKTLREVVPTVFEPALRAFLEPAPVKICDKCGKEINGMVWVNGDGTVRICGDCMAKETSGPLTTITPPPEPSDSPQVKSDPPKAISVPTVKRCELCDMPTERRFNLKGRKVCYSCWRDGIIAEAVPEPPVNSNDLSEGPSPFSVSGGAS